MQTISTMRRTADGFEHKEIIDWREMNSNDPFWDRGVIIETLEYDAQDNPRRFIQEKITTLGRSEGVAAAIAAAPKVPHMNELGVPEINAETLEPVTSSMAEVDSPLWNPTDISLNDGWELVGVEGAITRRPDKDDDTATGDTGNTGGLRPTLPEANGQIVSDNFQDGQRNAPFNLQVRGNVNNQDVDWQALVKAPYGADFIATLDKGPYTVESEQVGEGAWLHLFTGTEQLSDFEGITITGPAPKPAGEGMAALSLYAG